MAPASHHAEVSGATGDGKTAASLPPAASQRSW